MTQTKQQLALHKMAAFGGFQCPSCGMPLLIHDASLRCVQGHSYDVARKGYVHLHHKTVQSAYDKALFESRRTVFEEGFYQPVVSALDAVLQPISPHTLLDAGCGEGFYTDALSHLLPKCLMIGVDLSKDAIYSAAGRSSHAIYCVGDLNRLPFIDDSFDVILNILSPASYINFERVLKRDGFLIKIMPGREYLQEIRSRLPGNQTEYDDSLVPDYLKQHMSMITLDRLHYTHPLSDKSYAHFLAMTPLTESLSDNARIELMRDPPSTITIDLQLAVCSHKNG